MAKNRVQLHTNAPREIHFLLARSKLAIELGVRERVINYTVLIQREIVRTMTEDPKTGRFYRRSGRWHQASAAGESPAVDSGRLVNSIRSALHVNNGTYQGQVFTSVSYAKYLEHGTSQMAKRPAFAPSLDKYKTSFIASIRQLIVGL